MVAQVGPAPDDGNPLSFDSALWPASTTARSPEAVLITVARTKSACSNGLALRAPSATFLA